MRFLCAAAALTLGSALTTTLSTTTPPATAAPTTTGSLAEYDDTRELDPAARADLGPVRTDALTGRERRAEPMAPGSAGRRGSSPSAGDLRWFLALDDVEGYAYFKEFRLRGTSRHAQVWVAEDTAFPDGDCRNDLGLAEVTDAQVTRLLGELDTTIHPRLTRVFGAHPPRDGTGGAAFAAEVGLPEDHWQVGPAQADDLVVLVDNVRDDHFYDPASPAGRSFVAGFFTSTFTELLDRNVVTLDAFDWLHRTGATPPDHAADPAYQACAAALGMPGPDGPRLGVSRPWSYESTLTHEYTHLLQHEVDPDEATWVGEGLADWAQTLAGYVDPRVDPADPAADTHLRCFSGHAGAAQGGPENSLTRWGDQGAAELLCDYGAAYSFVEYLHSHHGDKLLGELHRAPGNGFDGLEQALRARRVRAGAQQVLRSWAVAVAVDQVLERNGRRVVGAAAAPFTARSLSSSVRWDNPRTHDAPGVPPNGSDYVRLRDAAGRWLPTADLRSLRFRGGRTTGDGAGPVDGWTVQLVAYAEPGGRPGSPLRYHRLKLDRSGAATLVTRELRTALGWTSSLVAAVVTHEDPDEDAGGPAPYRLEVNGVLQPGGGELGGGS